MNSVSQMVALMRGLLDDQQDQRVPVDVKQIYVTAGVDWLFDDVWASQTVDDLIDAATVDLSAPTDGILYAVMLLDADGVLHPWEGYRIVGRDPADPNGGLSVIVNDASPVDGTCSVRTWWAVPFTIPATLSDPIRDLPSGGAYAAVYYAMSLATAVRLDGRTDYTRYSTVNENSVSLSDVVGVSQFWLDRAEREKARVTRPLPPVIV